MSTSPNRPDDRDAVVVQQPPNPQPIPPPQPEPAPTPQPQPTPGPPHPDPVPPQAPVEEGRRVDREWRSERPNPGRVAARAVMTIVGAALLILSPWLDWIGSRAGTKTTIEAYWRSTLGPADRFFESAGIVMIVLGALGLIGLAFKSGWLTRIVGILGIVALILFAIAMGRTNADIPGDVGPGLWVALAGSILLLVAGFVAPDDTTRRERTTDYEAR